MNRVWICMVFAMVTGVLHAQSVSGDWQGTLENKEGSNRLMLQIVKTQSDGWEATLYRMDQGGEPESVPSVEVSGSQIRLGLTNGGTYDAAVNANFSEISGTWKEGQLPPRRVSFQRATKETAWENLDSDAVPPVTQDDVRIVERARTILSSTAKWNRADNRECPATATTFSLYCALDRATVDVSGCFEHRGAAMQEARFVIDDDLAKGNHYEHRLMDYNNDPKTTFADVQEFFQLLEERVEKRLKNEKTEKSK